MKANLIVVPALVVTAIVLTECRDDPGVDGEPHTAIVTETLEPYECGTITRLHTFGGVFLASQPASEDFEQAKRGGVVTVINLRHADEIDDFDEQQVVEGLGLAYHNPAWNGPDELTDAIFDEVRGLLAEAPRPILIHCASGNRVGAMWLAYRALDDGLGVEEATAEARIVGLKSPVLEEMARGYVERVRAM